MRHRPLHRTAQGHGRRPDGAGGPPQQGPGRRRQAGPGQGRQGQPGGLGLQGLGPHQAVRRTSRRADPRAPLAVRGRSSHTTATPQPAERRSPCPSSTRPSPPAARPGGRRDRRRPAGGATVGRPVELPLPRAADGAPADLRRLPDLRLARLHLLPLERHRLPARLRRPRQLPADRARLDLLAVGRAHLRLRDRRGAGPAGDRAGAGAGAQQQEAALLRLLPHAVLPAGGHLAGRRRRRRPADALQLRRHPQRLAAGRPPRSARPVDWLGNPKIAMGIIIVVGIWQTLGYNLVYFLAGLQTIPEEVYEAAKIDGAGHAAHLLAHHRADAAPGRPDDRDPRLHRLLPGLRPGAGAHRRRPVLRHRGRQHLHLPPGLRRQPGRRPPSRTSAWPPPPPSSTACCSSASPCCRCSSSAPSPSAAPPGAPERGTATWQSWSPAPAAAAHPRARRGTRRTQAGH